MRIYKQSLILSKTYKLPKYLNVNHFGSQDNRPCMWYLYDGDEPATLDYELHCLPTGGEVPDNIDCWLGTIQGDDGLVFHYYLKRV